MPLPAAAVGVAVVLTAGLVIGGILYFITEGLGQQRYSYDPYDPSPSPASPPQNIRRRRRQRSSNEKKLKEEVKSSDKEKEGDCRVCYNSLYLSAGNDEEIEISTLRCGHKYHSDCLKQWFEQCASYSRQYRPCPTCHINYA